MDDHQKVPAAVAKQLCDINYEIGTFLNKFADFRKTNVVDSVLCQNLSRIIEEIESYMDSSPKHVPSPEFSNFDVDLAENFMEKVLICNICKVEVNDRVHTINNHITSHKHISRKKTLKENQLPKGAANNAEERQNKKLDKNARIPIHKTIPKKMGNFVRSNFFEYLSKTAAIATALIHIPEYDHIRKSLNKTLLPIFPNAKIHFFGSRISGLGSPDSDLDIFLDVDNNYNTLLDAEQVKRHVKAVKAALEKHKDEWNMFTAILSARTPILRVHNHKLRIDCDISFSSLGQCNTLLIKYLTELQPISRLMCLFVKRWFSTTSYYECFSSYVLTLLVIFHLQQQNYLPAIFVLQRCVDETSIGPWQGNFAQLPLSNFQMQLIPVTPENLLKQLTSFFNFCGTVNFAKFIICPFTGSLVERVKFQDMKEIFTRYEHYRPKLSKKDKLGLEKPMCVQDPLEQNHNVAKGVSTKVLATFCQDCVLTAAEMKRN